MQDYGIRELRAWMGINSISGPRTTKDEAIASIRASGKIPPAGWTPDQEGWIKTEAGWREPGQGGQTAPAKPGKPGGKAEAENALKTAMEAIRALQEGNGGGTPPADMSEYVKRPELAPYMTRDDAIAAHDELLRKIEAVRKEARGVVTVELKKPEAPPEVLGAQHFKFPDLLRCLAAGVNPMLIGPAGSGKTRAVDEAAKALKIRFFPQSLGPQTPTSQLMGYMDANGNYVRTVFREAFENGGLYLLDEGDRASSHVLVSLNAALANGYCSFPDDVIKRHPAFLCVLAANTFGTGADRQYVSASQLDAATLDRFKAKIEWPYDEALETAISGNAAWAARVQSVRTAVDALKVRHIVSPRASIEGAKLLAAGFSQTEVEAMAIWDGLDTPTREKIEAKIKEGGRK